MRGFLQQHSSTDAAQDVYLEFNFFDGVMVDCSDMGRSQCKSLNPPPVLSDKLLLPSPADEILGMTTKTWDKNVNVWNSRQKKESYGKRMPEKASSASRNVWCMEAVGRSWNSPSVVCDKSSLTSAADKILSMTTRTGGKDADYNFDWDGRLKQGLYGDGMPDKITSPNMSPNRNVPCLSSLGIHMCDCEDDSIYCNLATCMISTPEGRNTKIKDTSQATMVPDRKDTKGSEDNSFWRSSGKKQGNLSAEVLSSGNKDYRQNGRASASDLGHKSALAAWAAVVSDSSCCTSMSTTGLGETVSPKKGPKDRVPTLASHLELTGTALAQSKLQKDYGQDIDICLTVPSPPPPRVPSVTSSCTLKREFAGLKLNPGSLSINEPAPYGTLHGILHCTIRGGLPNYTFLLDDYEEVVTAKLWLEDMMLGKEQGMWRYSFYSLRGESKRKGKSGWKNWRRKDKLNSTLLGKMKVSSMLCSDEKQKFSVKSECILFSSRLNEPATVAKANVFTQNSSSLSTTEAIHCNDAACTVCSCPSSSPAALVTSSEGLSSMPSPVTTAASCPGLQSSSPRKFAGAEISQRSRQVTQKWSLRSGIPSTRISKKQTKNVSQPVIGVTPLSTDTNFKESLPGDIVLSSNQRHSELAALIIDVPFEMQDRQILINDEQHRQASITVILPSGNHGRPFCDLKGPSPLISRWKEGGKCDCKGWDLGCGLTVLSNSCQKNDGFKKSQRNEVECQSQPLRLYKQDTDQDDAYFSLAPQANGLVALDFRAPLSPLQAFAIAIATLHGKDFNVPLNIPKRTPTVSTMTQNLPDHAGLNQICRKKGDGLCIDASNFKDFQPKSAVNSKFEQTLQPQHGHNFSSVKVQGRGILHCASELALSFERV